MQLSRLTADETQAERPHHTDELFRKRAERKRIMNQQEQVWVTQALKGDQQAFNKLVEAYQRPVFNLTYRMLNDPEEAADAAQETFLRAYSRLKQYNPDHKFSTWVFSIANHHCIDRLRKRKVTSVSIDNNPVLQNLESELPRPEGTTMKREQAAELQALLNNLEPEYRTPLILRYWEELSYEEIAQSMELTVSAVKSRLFRARKQMAELYQQAEAAQSGIAAVPPKSGRMPVTRTVQPARESAGQTAASQTGGLTWRTAMAGL